MRDLGLLSRAKKEVPLSIIHRILHTHFYYGYFEWGGKIYKGTYQPIINKSLFDEVQEVLNRNCKAPIKKGKPFKYRGLLQCVLCGCSVVGDEVIKKLATTGEMKKYVYYHCTQGRGKCSLDSFKEEELDGYFELAFGELFLLP